MKSQNTCHCSLWKFPKIYLTLRSYLSWEVVSKVCQTSAVDQWISLLFLKKKAPSDVCSINCVNQLQLLVQWPLLTGKSPPRVVSEGATNTLKSNCYMPKGLRCAGLNKYDSYEQTLINFCLTGHLNKTCYNSLWKSLIVVFMCYCDIDVNNLSVDKWTDVHESAQIPRFFNVSHKHSCTFNATKNSKLMSAV